MIAKDTSVTEKQQTVIVVMNIICWNEEYYLGESNVLQ